MPDRSKESRGRPVTANFTEKTVEMTETVEEAVVTKAARVYEEIGLHKGGNETIHHRELFVELPDERIILETDSESVELQNLVNSFDGRFAEAEKRIDRVLARLGHE